MERSSYISSWPALLIFSTTTMIVMTIDDNDYDDYDGDDENNDNT